MSRKRNDKEVRRLAGSAMLLALAAALQLLSNYVQFGTFSITLALIPIVLAGILYGIVPGTLVGLAVGALTIAAPATYGGYFFQTRPAATIMICLVKMTMAGFLPALVFRFLRKRSFNAGVIVASLLAPLTNTGLFAAGAAIFFYPVMEASINAQFATPAAVLFLSWIGLNFVLEFVINAALSPALVYVSRFAFRKVNIGADDIGLQSGEGSKDAEPVAENN